VPETHPIRRFSDTFPWPEWVEAIEVSFACRFPAPSNRGRPAISVRVLLALELLKAETQSSDEQICARLRTDFAVMYACGIEEVEVDRSQEQFVQPETLSQFRAKFDEALLAQLLQIQSTDALAHGFVSPAHVMVDTFPSEQGTQRVNDAATLYKAKKNSSKSSRPSPKRRKKRR
jgi:hypothetical protein|tara:strand:- start:947 stop:1471 length:525 start_codon:yes stop_codon:yes gene_type:complete